MSEPVKEGKILTPCFLLLILTYQPISLGDQLPLIPIQTWSPASSLLQMFSVTAELHCPSYRQAHLTKCAIVYRLFLTWLTHFHRQAALVTLVLYSHDVFGKDKQKILNHAKYWVQLMSLSRMRRNYEHAYIVSGQTIQLERDTLLRAVSDSVRTVSHVLRYFSIRQLNWVCCDFKFGLACNFSWQEMQMNSLKSKAAKVLDRTMIKQSTCGTCVPCALSEGSCGM